jgi:protein ImuB
VRLLDPPQPVDVMALLPDHPPASFVWRRVRHRVRHADGPERIAGEWWRRDGEVDALRDYFRIEDEDGRRFWLFRRGDGADPATGDMRWFLHGLF